MCIVTHTISPLLQLRNIHTHIHFGISLFALISPKKMSHGCDTFPLNVNVKLLICQWYCEPIELLVVTFFCHLTYDPNSVIIKKYHWRVSCGIVGRADRAGGPHAEAIVLVLCGCPGFDSQCR